MISLEAFFTAHGYATDAPRIVMPFHRTILDTLQSMTFGGLPEGRRNLMILIPPRHGKTFLVRDFIAYALGAVPDSEFIYTGYSTTIAEEQTARIRETMASDWYRSLFPGVELDKSAADHFTTTAGGQVYGVGMGGSITGFGAGRKRTTFGGSIVIDDILKADDARSETMLRHCQEWYTGVLSSRKNYTDTPIVLIMQRLHPDDLAGHILRMEGAKWHVIKVPGLQPDGTALWPATKSAEDMELLKRVDEFTFCSQYQQEPQLPGGNMIKREWWRYYPVQNYDVNSLVFITADTALKAKTANDPSSLQCWHAQPEYLDLLEDATGRWEFPQLMRRVKAFWEKWRRFGASVVYIEDKASGAPLAQVLAEQGIPTKLWNPKTYNFPDDKVGRVKHSLFYLEAGRVRLPNDDQRWVEPFIQECSAFTGNGTEHDDRVDAMSEAISIWSWKGGGRDVKVA